MKTLASRFKTVKIPGMENNKFSIFEAVRDAYFFVGREWFYLLKVGILPVVLQIAASLFVQFERPEASVTEAYLWGFPATLLFAWFMFLEARLLLLGEKIDQLPPDPEYLRERQNNMKLSVIVALLFNMGMSGAVTLLLALADSGQWGVNVPVTLAGLLMIGAMFWAVRFGLLPILAAVGYPFRPFLLRVQGMLFSLRLIGMGFIGLFPVVFLFQLLLSLMIGQSPDAVLSTKMTETQQVLIIVASAPLSLLTASLLTAAAAYALKQLLGGRRDGILA